MIKVGDFRMETPDVGGERKRFSFMDSAKLGFGYVNGVRFYPEWHFYAIIREKNSGEMYFVQFPSEEFLEDYRNDPLFEVVKEFGPPSQIEKWMPSILVLIGFVSGGLFFGGLPTGRMWSFFTLIAGLQLYWLLLLIDQKKKKQQPRTGDKEEV